MYGAFEFLVMPFGLTNAPVTFYTLMNQLFKEYLDKFVVVYLDDIIVYSQTLEVHVKHLRTIFKVLRENTLFVKREKCYFAQIEILFLGHRISDGFIQMDKSKVQAVAEWQTLKKVLELRSFLGFVNYYRRFIAGYLKHTTPLTELLKKEQPWKWSDKCKIVFQDLKAVILEESVLKLSDYGEPFEVHTDASDFAIGGRSSTSNKSPFKIITGQQPSTPHTMTIGYTRSSPSAYHFAKEWH
ncbi:uncharacterized mitochondrial protein AtMg00860-like [Musa acuminata AAA Group]|uniref:uncharacterized mitochondrial protein AtMg00860-like n=1 Tax=Musa acuminata AAA Group TaxID=214697 RepID=UPI0031DE0436